MTASFESVKPLNISANLQPSIISRTASFDKLLGATNKTPTNSQHGGGDMMAE